MVEQWLTRIVKSEFRAQSSLICDYIQHSHVNINPKRQNWQSVKNSQKALIFVFYSLAVSIFLVKLVSKHF